MFFGWEKQAFHFGLLQFMHWNLGGSQWLGTMDRWASFVCSFDLQKLDHRYSGHLGDPSRLPVGCPVSTNFLLVPGHARPCTPKISVKVASAQHNWSLEDFVPSTTAFLPGNDVKDLQFKYVQFSSHKKLLWRWLKGKSAIEETRKNHSFAWVGWWKSWFPGTVAINQCNDMEASRVSSRSN